MSADIIHIRSDKTAPAKALQELIEMAARQELDFLCVVATRKDEDIITLMSGPAECIQPFSIVGALEYFKKEFLEEYIE